MSLPRYTRKRMNPVGASAKRKAPTRQRAYQVVSRRAKDRCELCDTPQPGLDPHHTFGRGHLAGIPEEVCEDPALILGVCRRCHDRIHDGDVGLADRARLVAAGWYAEAHGLPFEPVGDPVDLMRELVRLAAEAA